MWCDISVQFNKEELLEALPCANYFKACWSAHCNLRSFCSLCGQSGGAKHHWTSLNYSLHRHILTGNMSLRSLSLTFPCLDRPNSFFVLFFYTALKANWTPAVHMLALQWQAVTLNQRIRHHSGPWSISDSQITLPAWLTPISASISVMSPIMLCLQCCCFFFSLCQCLFSPFHPASSSFLRDSRPFNILSCCLALSNIQYPFLSPCLLSPYDFFFFFYLFCSCPL